MVTIGSVHSCVCHLQQNRHIQVIVATLNSSEDTSRFLTLLRELQSELPRSMLEQTFLFFREMIS